MKKIITLILLLITINSFSQKYISFTPSLYTNAGSFDDRFSPTFEVGKQWKSFSLGLDLGKLNTTPQKCKDTTFYLELRPNLNVFQQDNFTNTLTIGLGYVINSTQPLMNELTTGIEYTPSKRYSYNIYIGTYYFSGRNSASNSNFFGASIMYYLY